MEKSHISIGDRAFASTASGVSARAGSFLSGLLEANIFGCLKHFPGQGNAPADTHLGSAVVEATIDQLHQHELKPFKDCLDRAPMVMMSHCIYPALDERHACLSGKIINGLLREQLGYTGLVVSDDMTMKAIDQNDLAWQGKMVEAIAAGVDILLVCKGLDAWKRLF